MAAIRKRCRQDGKIAWQVDYLDTANKRRHRQFPTKHEADAFLVTARSEVTRGTHTPDSVSITVKAAASLWLARCEREGLERSTTDSYEQHLRLHILPELGTVKLSRVTVPLVNDFRNKLLDAGTSRPMVSASSDHSRHSSRKLNEPA